MLARPSVVVHPCTDQGSASAVPVYLAKELAEQPTLVQELPWKAPRRPMPSLPATGPRTHYFASLLLPVLAFEPGPLRLPKNAVAYSRKRTQECSQCDHIPTRSVASPLK